MTLRKDVVERALEERLLARGFTREIGGIFLRDIDDQAREWVSVPFASAKRGGQVDADPLIGVRVEPAFSDVRRLRLPALHVASGDLRSAREVIARERHLLLELEDPESLRDYDAFAERLLDAAQSDG